MNGISLFTGSGIGELVLKEIIPGYRTVGYVEWDEHCASAIEQRIKDGVLDDAPIWQTDIGAFNRRIAPIYSGYVDFISAGFPCQPFSFAGLGYGEADERNQWPETGNTIRILRPRYLFLENVPGLFASKYIYTVLADLALCGYDGQWDIVGADLLEMRHHRTRGWILLQHSMFREQALVGTIRRNRWRSQQVSWNPHRTREGEPPMVGVAHGVAHRMDRLRCIGNGWVPQVVARILTVTGAPTEEIVE